MLAIILPLVPAVITFIVLSALGLMVGTCEADLNSKGVFYTWFGMAAVSVVFSYPLFLVGGRHVLPKARRDQLSLRLRLPVVFVATVATFLLGVVYVITHSSCVD